MNAMEFAEQQFNDRYPGYNDLIVKYFVNDEALTWSDKCYVPIAATLEVANLMTSALATYKDFVEDAGLMAAFAGWVKNDRKSIEFDEIASNRLMNMLYDEPIINIDKIFESIGFGTYFDLRYIKPFRHIDSIRALVHIEYDVNTKKHELRADLLTDKDSFVSFYLNIQDGWLLSDCIMDTLETTEVEIKERKAKSVLDIRDLMVSKVLKSGADVRYYMNELVFYIIFAVINEMGKEDSKWLL